MEMSALRIILISVTEDMAVAFMLSMAVFPCRVEASLITMLLQ